MDPTNNPVPTPNPAPAPGVPPVAPAGPAAPVPPVAAPQPAAPAAPAAPTPVNPVINPVVPAGNTAPANPVFQPKSLDGVAATDPIMRPDPVPAPDPIEEELKAPMKAAAPVPGSIGSAVSGPEATGPEVAPAVDAASTPETSTANPFATEPAGATPSVSFTDPATQPDVNPASAAAKPAKKKTSKTTLIALVVVAFMVVIALAAVLIIQLMGSSEPAKPAVNPTPAPVVEENEDDVSNSENSATVYCTSEAGDGTSVVFGYDIENGKIISTIQGFSSSNDNNEEPASTSVESVDWQEGDEEAINSENETVIVEPDGTLNISIEEFKDYIVKASSNNGNPMNCSVQELYTTAVEEL